MQRGRRSVPFLFFFYLLHQLHLFVLSNFSGESDLKSITCSVKLIIYSLEFMQDCVWSWHEVEGEPLPPRRDLLSKNPELKSPSRELPSVSCCCGKINITNFTRPPAPLLHSTSRTSCTTLEKRITSLVRLGPQFLSHVEGPRCFTTLFPLLTRVWL